MDVSPAREAVSVVQRCACGGSAHTGGECAACRRKRLDTMQTKLRIGAAGDRYEREADRVAAGIAGSSGPFSQQISRLVQRASPPAKAAWAPAEVDATLASGGRPLPDDVRSQMEARFGHDFARVRVHDGSSAAVSAAAVGARAYTVGPHVVFGSGEYQPDSSAGRRLLAHELTHVVQQGASAAGVGGSLQRLEIEIASGCPGDFPTIHQGVKDARVGIARIADPEARACIREQLDASTLKCRSGEDCGGTTYKGHDIDIFEWGHFGCPSLPALIVHEAAHKCKIWRPEMFAEACENEAFGGQGATVDAEKSGGTCEL